MKPLIPFALFLLAPVLKASNAAVSMIPQPANLVGDSIPGCIPLTSSVCYANYNYGIHAMISAPSPFISGPVEWKSGIESNHNLASVFGIRVDPTDGTMVPQSPVNIHIKNWPAPVYSPHTKSEVLAATIHCLLQSSGPSADTPLKINILTENKKDQSWAGQYDKKYVLLPGADGKPVVPTKVGDSILTTDGYGTQHVIFPKKNPKHLTPKARPVILPVSYGNFADGESLPALVPVWPGTDPTGYIKDPLQTIGLPQTHFYNRFHSGFRFSLESNPLLTNKQYFSINFLKNQDSVEARMSVLNQPLTDLAAGFAAAAMTAKLHHGKALKITVDCYSDESGVLDDLLKTPGWEEAEVAGRTAATTVFDYDPKTKKLIKGTLPGKVVLKSFPNGSVYLDVKPR